MGTGGASFSNLLKDAYHTRIMPRSTSARMRKASGAIAVGCPLIAELEQAIIDSRKNRRTSVFVIDTGPLIDEGHGRWWDVAVPEGDSRAGGQQRLPRQCVKAREARSGLGDLRR